MPNHDDVHIIAITPAVWAKSRPRSSRPAWRGRQSTLPCSLLVIRGSPVLRTINLRGTRRRTFFFYHSPSPRVAQFTRSSISCPNQVTDQSSQQKERER